MTPLEVTHNWTECGGYVRWRCWRCGKRRTNRITRGPGGMCSPHPDPEYDIGIRWVRFARRYFSGGSSPESVTEVTLLNWLSHYGAYPADYYLRTSRVLWLRFGVEPPLTLRAVGADIGVTPERVRQIEAKGLRMLRHPSRKPWESIPTNSRLSWAVFGEP